MQFDPLGRALASTGGMEFLASELKSWSPSLIARDRSHRNAHPRDHLDLNRPRGLLYTPSAMSLSCRYAAQCCARQIRSTSSLRSTGALSQQRITRRYQSTEAAAAPSNPKIAGIVDQISQLTLLETADLVTSLKVRRASCRGLEL